MGIGRTNTGGGGGGGLNFKVVGGTTAPNNPKENTIWINTDADITSWVFSVTEPTGKDGMVWISTGTSSPVEFNALKKNGIVVCPISATQYISGTWVEKTAKSYQNGKWVDWIRYLYDKGNEFIDITGGWDVGSVWKWSPNSAAGTSVGASKTAEYIRLHNTNQSATTIAVCGTMDKIDLTGAKTVVFVLDIIEPTETIVSYAVSKSQTLVDADVVAQTIVHPAAGTDVLVSIDVSSVPADSYYIGAGQGKKGDIHIKGVYLA